MVKKILAQCQLQTIIGPRLIHRTGLQSPTARLQAFEETWPVTPSAIA